MTFTTDKEEERVVLIGIYTPDSDLILDELERLADTAGAVVVGRMTQKRETFSRTHYFGKGKLNELKEMITETNATGVICDDELTASQMRQMSDVLGSKVMDRTLLILDIFAKHAVSAEGKVQVELAQLKYNLSHLTGLGKQLSRLGGGIGTRGPGEKKLETDRRQIRERIHELNRELKTIETHRETQRGKRQRKGIPVIALVGYTNSGKSTLMNQITDADVLVEDKLFATLDTTTRKISMPSGADYLFTDTVGFIRKLPHNLVNAFKATLDELKYADILIHVVDASDDEREEQMEAVYGVLSQLVDNGKPIITAFNKIDKENVSTPLPKDMCALKTVSVSAKEGAGMELLLLTIEETIKSFKSLIKVLIPYTEGHLVELIHKNCEPIHSEHTEAGVYIEAFANDEFRGRFKDYYFIKE